MTKVIPKQYNVWLHAANHNIILALVNLHISSKTKQPILVLLQSVEIQLTYDFKASSL